MSEELSGCISYDNMNGTGVGILSEVFPRGEPIELLVPAGKSRRIDVYGVYPNYCIETDSSTDGGAGGGGYYLGRI